MKFRLVLSLCLFSRSLIIFFFYTDDLNGEVVKEKWDKVRIVCIQPFRKDTQFGLSLFRIHTNTKVLVYFSRTPSVYTVKLTYIVTLYRY